MDAKVRGISEQRLSMITSGKMVDGKWKSTFTPQAQAKELGIAGLTPKEYKDIQARRSAVTWKGEGDYAGKEVTVMMSKKELGAFEEKERVKQFKGMLRGMDVIAAGGVPSEYRTLAPQTKADVIKERVEKGIYKIMGADKNESRSDKVAIVSSYVLGGIDYMYETPKYIKKKVVPLFNPEIKTSIATAMTGITKGALNIGTFFYEGIKGTPKLIYTGFRKGQQLRTGFRTKTCIEDYKSTPSSIRRQYPTYESYEQRMQKGNIITQKLDVILKPTKQESIAAVTLLSLGVLSIANPILAKGVGNVMTGAMVFKTVTRPSYENVGELLTFGGLTKLNKLPLRPAKRTLELPTKGKLPSKISLFGFETKGGKALTLISKTPKEELVSRRSLLFGLDKGSPPVIYAKKAVTFVWFCRN